MCKIREVDEQLFRGAAAKIHEFSDIEPLMPPGRLRLSKLLGRPVMDDLTCNCIIANIEELRSLSCVVNGGMVEWVDGFPESYTWTGPVIDAPDLVGVRIISDEDKKWGLAWYKKEGQNWPLTGDGTYPPAMEKLVDSYEEFYYDWDTQMSEADYDEPHSPDAFGVCTICGSMKRK